MTRRLQLRGAAMTKEEQKKIKLNHVASFFSIGVARTFGVVLFYDLGLI